MIAPFDPRSPSAGEWPIVRATNVAKRFGTGELATAAVRGVSCEVRAGELVLLIGPSGSGKTSLVSILAGLLSPTSGRVEWFGKEVSNLKEPERARLRRAHLGFVFQGFNLLAALTAFDNVAEMAMLKGHPRREARHRAEQWLANVGLSDRMHRRPNELSAGQRQRVAIARALVGDPSLTVGDEVTSALDAENAEAVVRLLRDQVAPTRAVLLVTHDHRLRKYADRVLCMEDGVLRDDDGAGSDRARPPVGGEISNARVSG